MNATSAANDQRVTRLRGIDWTGQKRTSLKVRVNGEVTVGEVAELLRERMRLPRGSYAVYHQSRKLNRTDTLDAAALPDEAELEINPEVKAGRD